MNDKKLCYLLAAVWLFAITAPVVAQDEADNEGIAIVVVIEPKDGHDAALREAVTSYHHWIADKEGAMRYQWYSILTGPDTGSYIARSGDHNWADFDNTADWRSEGAEKFAAEIQPHIEDVQVMYTMEESDWGIWPENIGDYRLFQISHWWVKPGHNQAFRDGVARIDATLKAGGFPNFYAFSRVVSGSHGNHIVIASPRKNYADMSPKSPSFMEVMGAAMGGEDEVQAFMAEWSQTYKAGDNYLIQLQPELSDYGD